MRKQTTGEKYLPKVTKNCFGITISFILFGSDTPDIASVSDIQSLLPLLCRRLSAVRLPPAASVLFKIYTKV